MTEKQTSTWSRCLETAQFLKRETGDFIPEMGIVLGSGLGNLKRRIQVVAEFAYEDIPHFKPTSVVGHHGNLIFGTLAGKKVVCQQGRYHYYEGHTIAETVFPVRVMKALGAGTLLVSNAAGGINLNYRVGDIMLIADQINFQGTNPLMGPNEEEIGPRFPDMTFGFDPQCAESLLEIAAGMDLKVHQGVYISVTGPSYETPAEIKMFRMLGADAVGMSTANEVLAANHCGMKVIGLSCISNAAAGMSPGKLDHGDVGKVIERMSLTFEKLVEAWIGAQ